MRKRSAEEKQKQLERFLMNVAEAADAALWEYWREKEAEHRRFATEYVTRRGAYPATVTAWQTAGGQGKLHFPYAALRQLPLCELAGSEHLLRKLFTSRKSEKNVRQHSGTQKGAIEAITSIHTGYMIRAPTFRRSTQRQEPHPLQLNTAAPQNLRSAGTAAFTRGRFFCAAAYADRLLSACRTAADAAERIYLWHFSIAQ